MRSSAINGTAKGALLGVIAFVLVTSAMPLTATAASSSGPLFSITLIAPTTNPARRQWASIITSSLDSVNIGASLVFVSFTVLLDDFFACPTGCPTASYANGGFDAGFVGYSVTEPLPDYGTQNVVGYLNSASADFPPIGSDYYFWTNSTYNTLAAEYNQAFTNAARIPLIQQMAAIIAQERPAMVLFYESAVYAYPTYLQSWSTNVVNTGDVATDYSHWKTTGTTVLNIAEPGDIADANVLPTAAQNSFYATYLTGNVGACGQCLDPRTNSYYNGTVTGITSSSNHLTWTVNERAHDFSDGVPVTSNDYIYATMAELINDVGYVGEGTAQTVLGLSTSFTFTNGTTDYIFNGTYYGSSLSTATSAGYNITAGTSFSTVNATAWTFTMGPGMAYAFTDPVITGVSAIPMHIYSEFPFSDWSTGEVSGFSSSGAFAATQFTYTWTPDNCAQACTAGTTTAYGPVGDGPYLYEGYNPTSETGTMTRNPTYWNATALQAEGYDAITTVHVVYINSKDAAVAAYSEGTVNFLDSNYAFDSADVASLKTTVPTGASGTTVYIATGPTSGWQEMGLNVDNNEPVWGSGLGTPACGGTCSAAQAHQYALDVREAISLLIPRQDIINELEGGLGVAGIEQFSPFFTSLNIYGPSQWEPNGIQSDPYNPTMAKSYLAAAGYNTGVSPPSTSGLQTLTSPTISGVTVPGFLLGNTFTLTGAFKVDAALAFQSGGFVVTLEQNTAPATCTNDTLGSGCWTPVATGATNTAGDFSISFAPTTTGNQSYRVFMTGIPNNLATLGATNPGQVESDFWGALTEGDPINVTDAQLTTPSAVNVGTLGDLITALIGSTDTALSTLTNSTSASIAALQSSTSSSISGMTNSVSALTSSVNSLKSSVSTAEDIAYVAIAVAIILGIAAIALASRKPRQ